MSAFLRRFSPPAQLLGKMLEKMSFKRVLIALPQEPGLAKEFEAKFDEVQVWHHHYGFFLRDGKKGRFGVEAPQGDFDLVCLFLPKEIGRAHV